MGTLIIADTQPLFRDALGALLRTLCAPHGNAPRIVVLDSLRAVMEMDEAGTSAVLLDTALLDDGGMSGLVALRGHLPAVPIVLFAPAMDHDAARLSMACGAAGYIPKTASAEDIAGGLRIILRGGIVIPPVPKALPAEMPPHDCKSISSRQAAVLDLVTDGKSNKQIAWELAISETTVKAHMSAILRKLGVSSRAQAIVLLQRQSAAGSVRPLVHSRCA